MSKKNLNQKITFKELSDPLEFKQCIMIQNELWAGKTSHFPLSCLSLLPFIGGVVIGAFDKESLVGFVYGAPAVFEGEMAHWSGRLGVLNTYQNLNLGLLLKEKQRIWCLNQGIKSLYWSFDPLQSKNAHFNLNKCKASVYQICPKWYPKQLGVTIKMQDRFIVKWESNNTANESQNVLSKEIFNDIINYDKCLTKSNRLKVAIPLSIDSDINQNQIRKKFSQIFNQLQKETFEVEGFFRDKTQGYYIFKKKKRE